MSNANTIRTVLATVPYTGWHLEKLRNAFGPEVHFIHLSKDDTAGIAEALEEADVAILQSDLDERYLAAPKLRWIHCDHSGLNKSARPEVFERGLQVTGSAGRSGPVLAEHIFFLTLSLIYDAHGLHDAQKEHRWRGIPGYEERRGLYGKTMGIIGMGFTGKELAVRAKAFGMRVLGYRRSVTEPPAGVDKLFCADRGETIDELLRESDVVVLAVRLSDETHHLIGEAELQAMKNTAYLINMARGLVIDEQALIHALHQGIIGGAGLDTFAQEPLPADNPLWDAPNLVITPHCTPEMPDLTARSLDIICDNIVRYREGRPLLNELVPNDVYTK
ncbi:D-2-hydroxyacid dehydrogenase [Paenibacillus thalictri]|uniref:D-2-hydroxyacid dehydrogenase n=1 Tax=Paenibacillus thalictri TaxID=2527873 RepID=A0A4Q9DVA3_9BACL|nr:D-2-hydroxyacid dehydrogenase [Paenibacillus thalictri]TBL79890.1 D-2-hydroxyacid dehydrogenase [Paenibacillus thalictri]